MLASACAMPAAAAACAMPVGGAPVAMRSARRSRSCAAPPPRVGTANAARVSRGSMVDKVARTVKIAKPQRDASQHVTVKDALHISDKLVQQPYVPPPTSNLVVGGNVF